MSIFKKYGIWVIGFIFLTGYCLGEVSTQDSDKVIQEIELGMKKNLDMVKTARGITRTKFERYLPERHGYDIENTWTLKDNRLKDMEKAKIVYSEKSTLIYQNYLYFNSKYKIWDMHLTDSKNPSFIISPLDIPKGKYTPYHPYYRGLSFDGMSLNEFIDYVYENKWEFKIVGTETLDGDPCYLLERIVPETDSTKNIMRFWIDPMKGYGIMKGEVRIDEGKPYTFYTYKYKSIQDPETQKKFWYPEKIKMIRYNQNKAGELKEESEVTQTFWEINETVTDKDVDYYWKPGVLIRVLDKNKSDNFTIKTPGYTEEILSGKIKMVPYESALRPEQIEGK